MSTLNVVESIFIAALERNTPEARAAYLAEACAGDVNLLRCVERLLAAHARADSLLPAQAPGLPLTSGPSPPEERVGSVIGPYKLLQQVGEGGFGVVFLAEQEQPVRRKVALKLIKPGMDSRQVVARFEAERQALALMDHPNVARVLDGGVTEDGRPYFVMELIKGTPITEFCDQNRLSPRERLELFIPVCQAVHHAHQKGIIHRDLKPSNVLVTMYDDKPVPKVIDFGIAKAIGQNLTEQTLFTVVGQFLGTLEYVSPEQASLNALDVDTRADVYALGVMLYELLTGTTPLDKGRLQGVAFLELLRLVREEEPPRPSTRLSGSGNALAAFAVYRRTDTQKLPALVKGELDWIAMKALEKDRSRRYDTASALAADVRRYLADEQVEACPPSAGYRLRKLARKHRKLLATAAAFAAVLLVGVAVSSWQAVLARQAEAQARQKEDEASQQRNEAREQRDKVQALNENLEAAQAELRDTLYTAQVNLAQQAWQAGGAGRARELLEQQRPREGIDLRGFEWFYLDRLSRAGQLAVLTGHANKVTGVAYSPDGKRLASASMDRTVKVWDAQTGKPLLAFEGHAGSVQALAFSPDGKCLASSASGEVKVWDAHTGKEFVTISKLPPSVEGVAFSPDCERLAIAGGPRGDGWFKAVTVWDARTGQQLLNLRHAGEVNSVAFSRDGKRLASASADKTVKVWDAKTGHELFALEGHTSTVSSVAYCFDGKRIVSGSYDKTLKVWDAEKGKELLTLEGSTDTVYGVAFSPDGKRVAGACRDRSVRVWDAEKGQEVLTLKGHDGMVLAVAFSPDGKRLASGSWDNTVMIWDVGAVKNPLSFKLPVIFSTKLVAFSQDGERLISDEGHLLDARTGQGVGPPKAKNVRVGAISADGKLLACVFVARFGQKSDRNGEVTVWDVRNGKTLHTFEGGGSIDGVIHVAFSADGKRLARATSRRPFERGPQAPGSRGVMVWDVSTGQELLSVEAGGQRPAFSPDGKRLAVFEPSDEMLAVWDAQTGQKLLAVKGFETPPGKIVFSPDGKRLASVGAGFLDHTVKVWDAETGQELLAVEGSFGIAPHLAFSPDGKRLATCGKVWDAQTGQELFALKGHTDVITAMAFSPDGKRLASVSLDRTVKVWDARTGAQLLTLELNAGNGRHSGVAFSPDGHRLAASGVVAMKEVVVNVWDATPLPEGR